MTNKEMVTLEAYESPTIEDIAPVSMLKGQDATGGSDTTHDDDEM